MTTDPDRLVPIGRVGKPHGLDGAFVVEGGSDDARRFEVGARILADGLEARVVVSRQVGKGRRAVKLDRHVERGAELAVRRADLPQPDEGSYYVTDLVGLLVVDADGTEAGRVRDVLPGPANDALELDSGALLPLVEDCVREVDLETGRVHLYPGFTD
ncbi:MAG: ribosome maturation factor RimM [Gaiellaceae bacterium]